MVFKLIFDFPPEVSQEDEPDILVIRLYGQSLFQDYSNQAVDKYYEMRKILPRQIDPNARE